MTKTNRRRKPSTQKASRFSIRASAARQVIADQVQFTLPQKQWQKFCDALDASPKTVPALRRLLTKPGLFDAHG